ncbi:cell division protein FtsA [bacterium]|nr:cell division protein FtsA [bacterium]MBU1073762.1 cell division protein FtsA [bacterium]MBU1674996.1 cell division protein FtsA [bacterium]
MEYDQLIVVCDLGTTEFRTLVAAPAADGGLQVLGAGVSEAAGFRDGDFVDIGSGSRALARAVRMAESDADVDISGFYYGISGSHLRSVWARGRHQIGPGRRSVTDADIAAVIERANSIAIPFDHAILATNPVAFSVDGIGGIVDPVDRRGSMLEVNAYLITGSRSVQSSIEKTIERAGYHAAGWRIDALATAQCLLSAQEQREGVVLIDVGGHMTQWVIFRSGRIAGSGMVPWGGAHMTSDLAHGLRVGQTTAEATKCESGLVLRSMAHDEVDTDVLFDDDDDVDVSPGLIAAILEPRLEEIFRLVREDMGASFEPGLLLRGAVVTGGGARCEGTAELCEEVLGLPAEVRLAPYGLSGGRQLPDGQWATAVGLAFWALAGDEPVVPPEGTQAGGRGVGGFFKGLFRRG